MVIFYAQRLTFQGSALCRFNALTHAKCRIRLHECDFLICCIKDSLLACEGEAALIVSKLTGSVVCAMKWRNLHLRSLRYVMAQLIRPNFNAWVAWTSATLLTYSTKRMDLQRASIKVLGFVLFCCLLGYFINKVVQSIQKLQKKVRLVN